MTSDEISADFPFAPRFVEVRGSRIHYVDEGAGAPVLFLHGNPTSSYLWRNIIPHLTPHARCIAPDLIGMGKSDKPDLAYRFADHAAHVDGFIEALDLKNLTLVVHDWGSALGFHYARRHPDNVRAVAFMEAILRPATWDAFPKDFKIGFRLFRAPGIGWFLISVLNVFVERVLPQAIVRDLTREEHDRYREPFPTVASRKPVRRWPREIPIGGTPADVTEVVEQYGAWFQASGIPKLLFYGTPGGIIPPRMVEWCRANLPNLQVVDLGPGIHFLQEDNPHRIGRELARWYREVVTSQS